MKLKIFSQSGDGRITSGCFADFGDIEPPKNMTPYNISDFIYRDGKFTYSPAQNPDEDDDISTVDIVEMIADNAERICMIELGLV